MFYVVICTTVVVFFIVSNANPTCEFLNDWSIRSFYKVKECYRSDHPIISRTSVRSLTDCENFVKERGGLAFNFSPPNANISKYHKDYFFANCQALGCPEIGNTSLVTDAAFDYYSYFGDLNALEDASCIKSAGMFQVFQEKVNYTTAIEKCQDVGGDLAHIISEERTNGLSTFIKVGLTDWYRIAYVGLSNEHKSHKFETPLGEPLNCFKFRAWAPGQPRIKKEGDDCVAIDAENSWKVMNCHMELSFVCELFPMPPPIKDKLRNVDCSKIKDKDKRKNCRALKKDYKNSTHSENNVTVTSRCNKEL